MTISQLNGSKNVTVEKEVDKQLKKAKEDDKYKHKILLLGAGEAGKSTVLKQISMEVQHHESIGACGRWSSSI